MQEIRDGLFNLRPTDAARPAGLQMSFNLSGPVPGHLAIGCLEQFLI
jgi:hypothetical protein